MPKIPASNRHHFFLYFNPFWKKLATYLSTKCEKCGQERLLSAFTFYSEGKKPECTGCSIASVMAFPLISFIFKSLGIDEGSVKSILKDSLASRCMLSVVRGIANFGIMYPQPAGAPITVVWNFTNRCNLNCLHCHQDSSPVLCNKELSTSQAFKVVDNMSDAGVAIIAFSGGEPLMRNDIYDVIKRANDSGILCTVASNGTLLSLEVANPSD